MEILSFENHNKAFPLHYHKEYCISLIRDGVELIEINDTSFKGTEGDVTITHPYELHANPLFSENNALSFATLYISEADFKSLSNSKYSVYFPQRVLKDSSLKELFMSAIANPEERLLSQFISKLAQFGTAKKGSFKKPLDAWEQLERFIEHHIHEPISLEDMAGEVHLNKYSFARKFKKNTGITPIHYVLMKKVFHCKDMMTQESSFTDLAYTYNFTDVSHFSNCFKRFIGVTPTVYQQNCIV